MSSAVTRPTRFTHQSIRSSTSIAVHAADPGTFTDFRASASRARTVASVSPSADGTA